MNKTCKDQVWDKGRTSHESNLMMMMSILLPFVFGLTLSSTFDPTILILVHPNQCGSAQATI